MKLEIRKLSCGDEMEYERLAAGNGTIFNSLAWLKIFANSVQIYGIYDGNDRIIGGFCLYTQKKLGLKIHRNPPFTPCIGPFAEIKTKNPVAAMSFVKQILSLLADFLNDSHCSIVSVSINKEIVDTQPFAWKKFKVIPGYTYIIDLAKPVENIEMDMSAERRNDIRKATRDGVIIKQVDDFNIVKSLVLKTFSRQEMIANEYYMDKILFEFANKNNSFATVSFKNDCPIAASFCVHDNNTAYYLLGGYDYENKHRGAGALSVWGAIKYAKELGLKYFDFEGSMIPQIEMYFREFGGRLTPYYGINKAKLPLEIVLKFFKRERF